MHDKDYRDAVRVAVMVKQEVGLQAKRAVVANLEARADFEVGGFSRIWKFDAEGLANVAPFRLGRSEQVDPGWRLDAFEMLAANDDHLTQMAIDQIEGVHLTFGNTWLTAARQHLALNVRKLPEYFVLMRLRCARPQQPSILDRQGLQYANDLFTGHPGQLVGDFGHLLSADERFDDRCGLLIKWSDIIRLHSGKS